MKRKFIMWGLVALLAFFVEVSCSSAPPPDEAPASAETPAAPSTSTAPSAASQTPQDPEAQPPNQTALSGLDEAAARAKAARQLVIDFNGQELYPDDWRSADSLFSQAEQQRRNTTVRDTRESTERYNKAAEAFEAIGDEALAAAYEQMLGVLVNARYEAVKEDAQIMVPDYLLEADNLTLQAEEQFKAKDYYAAKESAEKALAMYEAQKIGLAAYWQREEIAFKAGYLVPAYLERADALGETAIEKYLSGDYAGAIDDALVAHTMYDAIGAGLEAYSIREEISYRSYVPYDYENLEVADDSLYSAMDDFDAGDYASAKDKASEAILRYDLALRKSWASFALEKSTGATTERQRALASRANVAVRDEFNIAQALYVRANSALLAQRYEEASSLFIDCQTQFLLAAFHAREKQREAEEALRTANQRMAESDAAARAAEIILEGGAL